MKIKEIFKFPIEREIDPIVKVSDEQISKIKQEINEYILTHSLEEHFDIIFEKILESKDHNVDNIGIWISGFFGSGKSLFLKTLSYILENKIIEDRAASDIFLNKLDSSITKANLATINKTMKIKSILFEIKSQEDQLNRDSITEIMYRQFNKSFGLSEQIWIAELEKELMDANKYAFFKEKIKEEVGEDWEKFRLKTLRLKPVLYKVLQIVYPEEFNSEEKIKESISSLEKFQLTPDKFAVKLKDYIEKTFESNQKLIFFIDEMGMFVGDNSEKLLELQSIIHELGVKCRGKVWIIVTAQEKLDEVIDGVKRKREQFTKITDRFPVKINLTSENIDKVVKERILKKKENIKVALSEIYKKNSGKLNNDINYKDWAKPHVIPKIDENSFIETYPFIPYQLSIIPDIFNNIRSKGSGHAKLSGRERSMLGVVHSIFNDPKIKFKDNNLGDLVTLDIIYDQITGELEGDIKRVINEALQVDGENGTFANKVLKSLFLMQQLTYIPRTASNISIFLYNNVNTDFKNLKEKVEKSLQILNGAQYVTKDHNGWKFLSLQEKKIEEQINSIVIKSYEKKQAIRNILRTIFDFGKISYKGGISVFEIKIILDGENINQNGDIKFEILSPLHMYLEEKKIEEILNESVAKSDTIYWVGDDSIDINNKIEKYERIKKIIDKKNQEQRFGNISEDERHLIREKNDEMKNLNDEIKNEIKNSFVNGTIIYQGKENRLMGKDEINSIFKEEIEKIIPKIYYNFYLAAVKVHEDNINDIFNNNFSKVAHIYKELELINNSNQININAPIIQQIISDIKNKIKYGHSTFGKDLIELYSKPPYGWNPTIVRLVLATLFRNGTIIAIHQQRTYNDFKDFIARDIFTKQNNFKNTKFDLTTDKDISPEQRTGCKILIDEIFDKTVNDTIEDLSNTIINNCTSIKNTIEKIEEIVKLYEMPFRNNFFELKKIVVQILDNQSVKTRVLALFLENANEFRKNVNLLYKISSFCESSQLNDYKRIKDFTQKILKYYNLEKANELNSIFINESFIDNWDQIKKEFQAIFEVYLTDYNNLIDKRNIAFKELLSDLNNNEIIKSLNSEEKTKTLEIIKNKSDSKYLLDNTPDFILNGESITQIRENIEMIDSFKENSIKQALDIIKNKENEKKTSNISYIKLNDLILTKEIDNEEQLAELIDNIDNSIKKELNQRKKVILA